MQKARLVLVSNGVELTELVAAEYAKHLEDAFSDSFVSICRLSHA
jgi:hypothetical protein